LPRRPARIRSALAHALAVPAFCATLTAFAEDCMLQKLASIPIEPSRSGSPVLTVKLNGAERRFLVDTGSRSSAIARPTAELLGLTPWAIPGGERYVGGQLIDRAVTVAKLQLGVHTASNVNLMLMPTGTLPDDQDGLLGAGLLMNFDLDFDFANHTLNLFSPKHCKGRVVYWTQDYTIVPFRLSDGWHLSVPMTLDGKRVWAIVDTGASDTFLSESSARRLFGLDDPGAGPRDPEAAAAAGYPVFSHPFLSLSFEGVEVKHPVIHAYPDLNQRAFDRNHRDKTQYDPISRIDLEQVDLIVGMNILQRLHVYVAYDEHAMYVSASGAH
jgi:predicted aspartyl protease